MRRNLSVVGKVLGTYEDYDDYDPSIVRYYEFIPNVTNYLPAGVITVNYETGEITVEHEGSEEPFVTTFLELIGAK